MQNVDDLRSEKEDVKDKQPGGAESGVVEMHSEKDLGGEGGNFGGEADGLLLGGSPPLRTDGDRLGVEKVSGSFGESCPLDNEREMERVDGEDGDLEGMI